MCSSSDPVIMNESDRNMQLPSPQMFLNPTGFAKGAFGLPGVILFGPQKPNPRGDILEAAIQHPWDCT